jgi:hypothetical protein
MYTCGLIMCRYMLMIMLTVNAVVLKKELQRMSDDILFGLKMYIHMYVCVIMHMNVSVCMQTQLGVENAKTERGCNV